MISSRPISRLKSVLDRVKSGRLALDYVSPLPPVRSGIADYSRDLLEPLSRVCDLRVVRLPGQPVSDEMTSRWEPVEADAVGEGGRVPLYHMGNNRHHEAVGELAREHPGVVVLHDLVLHHLALEVGLLSGELDPYLDDAAREHGRLGEWVAEARRWGDIGQAALFELSFARSLLRSQRGVLVHSRWAAEKLLDELPGLDVLPIPMAVPLPPLPEADTGVAVRRRLGLRPETPLVGSFGFQTPIKRTDQVIRALAEPALRSAHLMVGGEVTPVLDLDAVAREAGVADRVHFVGFLDFEGFEQAIAACDLCVNLRYPTAGETSASLLRVLALGKATLVSDYAQFAELPDEVVLKAPLGEDEVANLAERAGALLNSPDRLRAMGEAARTWVSQRHDPEAAARRVVEACSELCALPPSGNVDRPRPFIPTSLTWSVLPGELTVEGWRNPWRRGAAARLRLVVRPEGDARWLPTREDGGIQIQLAWRESLDTETIEQRWLALPRAVDAGEELELTAVLRRPPRGRFLIIEPHVRGLGGVSSIGGPRRVFDLEAGAEVEDAWTGTLKDLEEAVLDG